MMGISQDSAMLAEASPGGTFKGGEQRFVQLDLNPAVAQKDVG